MDDVKDKFKGMMKKVNNPFSSSSSSSSGRFKGQGRTLGSSSSSSSSVPSTNPIHSRLLQNPEPKKTLVSNPKPNTTKPLNPSQNHTQSNPKSSGFDPFDTLISSGKRFQSAPSVDVLLKCPICQNPFTSEEEVSEHIDVCVGEPVDNNTLPAAAAIESSEETENAQAGRNELASCVGAFVSGGPPEGSVEIVIKLLRNIATDPENPKFRRIRMSNPKIREAVGGVAGGVELLECVGFKLQEEGEEMWAVMEVPSEEQILSIREAVSLLDPAKIEYLHPTVTKEADVPVEPKQIDVEPKNIDRQVRVFFSVSESVAARIELPESFYNLSVAEAKREADLRKKKLAESQLLIPRSYKEKQAKAAKKRFKKTVIRIQFPDEVVLQGAFLPWESTTALYEFVSSSLKEPCLEFELWHHPAVFKRRAIPRSSVSGERIPTLEEEELVPSALVKFKPIETDSIVFTGLCNELLEISEPLTNHTNTVNSQP